MRDTSIFEDDMPPGLDLMLGALDEIRERPCVECGDEGDTFPCITCDKLVCGECGVGVRWCKEHKQDGEGTY